MKLLLDECLPRSLKRALPGCETSTVPEMGWASIKNGRLLALMEPLFDVFLTIDANLRYQQNLADKDIALVVLSATDNTIETLLPLMPQVAALLPALKPGQMIIVTAAGSLSEAVRPLNSPGE